MQKKNVRLGQVSLCKQGALLSEYSNNNRDGAGLCVRLKGTVTLHTHLVHEKTACDEPDVELGEWSLRRPVDEVQCLLELNRVGHLWVLLIKYFGEARDEPVMI